MRRIINVAPSGLLLGVLLLLSFSFSLSAQTRFDEKFSCLSAVLPERGIQACTRQIESGKYHGRDLAIAYVARGVNYDRQIFLEQFDASPDTLEKYGKQEKSDYDMAIKIDPSYGVSFYNRGVYYYSIEQYDLAIADLSESIRLGPNGIMEGADFRDKNRNQQMGYSYSERGRAYFKKGDFDRAVADFTKCLEFEPEKAQANFDRALAYKAKGDTARADADFDQAIKLDPKLKRPE